MVIGFSSLWCGLCRAMGRCQVSWGGHGWSHGAVTMATSMDTEFPSDAFTEDREKEGSCALCRLSVSVQTQGIQLECFLMKLLLCWLSILMMHWELWSSSWQVGVSSKQWVCKSTPYPHFLCGCCSVCPVTAACGRAAEETAIGRALCLWFHLYFDTEQVANSSSGRFVPAVKVNHV